MLLLEIKNLKKYYGERFLFNIDDLKIYDGERIGLVGINGSGKTTLMNIISGRMSPDEGCVSVFAKMSYVTQIQDESDMASQSYFKLGAKESYEEFLSGGEKLRYKISKAISENSELMLLDEPTTNMDVEGIKILEDELKGFKGAILVISHDRQFLDNICTEIWDLDENKITTYGGNFSFYIEEKERAHDRKQFEYDMYVKERERLKNSITDTAEKSSKVRKCPRRFGNSEARLCKMGDQKAKKNLDEKVKSLKSRLERLEVKEKPSEMKRPVFDVNLRTKLYNKYAVQGKDVTLEYGDRTLIKNGNFIINKGKIIGLIGANGCGKTTLIKSILSPKFDALKNGEIKISKALKIGYFAQDLTIIDDEKTVLENIMDTSIYDKTLVGILLVRMGFTREDFNKKAALLSGGEKVKVSLCRIFTSDFNMLILDEPTNYLDIYAMEELEETLKGLKITMLVVSHDRRFLSKLCTGIMEIKEGKLFQFNGTYDEYEKMKDAPDKCTKINEEELMVLNNRLSELISLISVETSKGNKKKAEDLDKEYYEVLREIKNLKSVENK